MSISDLSVTPPSIDTKTWIPMMASAFKGADSTRDLLSQGSGPWTAKTGNIKRYAAAFRKIDVYA